MKPTYNVPTIKDIHILPNKGPWLTKSNGQLDVLFGIDFANLNEKYFHYEKSELEKIAHDIRGLRSYRVDGLQNKSIGANEWHRIRNELVFAIKGSAKWTCEDVYGNHQQFTIDHTSGVWVPPFILHTYESQQNDSELLVIANTLFFPEDTTTHDSFSLADFKELQKQFRAS